jgi:2,4-dienoyl-CoA reductase-like NADH-dependent reductase (Old Yellow Enzyme family)
MIPEKIAVLIRGSASAAADKGEFDLLAVGRALIQDLHWSNKIRYSKHDELKQYSVEALVTFS